MYDTLFQISDLICLISANHSRSKSISLNNNKNKKEKQQQKKKKKKKDSNKAKNLTKGKYMASLHLYQLLLIFGIINIIAC